MLVHITHSNLFEYTEPVTESTVEFRLTPFTDVSQHLLQHRQRSTPPCKMRQYADRLGNTVTYLSLLPAHTRLEVVFESVVETHAVHFRGRPLGAEERGSPSETLLLHDFLQPTPLTSTPDALLEEFVAPFEALRGRPPLEAAEHIRKVIYGTFRYDGDVTSASSSVADILRHRAGVCQDFTHLMLAACRRLGFPARYVSGYTLTERAEEEVAASHAWCEVFDADRGWFGVDPTHDVWVDERHVRLGVGRDYNDVPPNRGLYRGTSAEELRVSVHLRPVAPEDLEREARAIPRRPPAADAAATRQARPPSTPSIVQQSLLLQQQQQQQQ